MQTILDDVSQESPPQDAPLDDASATAAPAPKQRLTLLEAIAPYPNYSAWLFNKHHWDQHVKSKGDRRKMQTEVFANPLFDSKEAAFVDLEGIDKKLSSSTNESFSQRLDDRFGRGWKTSTISIDVPHGVKKKKKNAHPTAEECRFEVPNVLHRSIPDVVCDAFKQPSGKSFHYTPFREYWERPDTKTTENVYGQFYSSAAFIEAHDELQNSPPEPDCSLPRAVAGIFMASDCAHLTDTGTAKIHPFNVLIANNDKYENGKPKSHAVHPVMVLPPLPDTIHDFANKLYNGKTKAPDNPIFTHCRREYYHGGLGLLFDAEFWQM
ncbi:hypothetical protein EXIGLDRAFT_463317 [Exidia glandulosa HHB12029]|uniref:Uncharacterized protein n=1 Tax=Exidia glandulosa HHB12029 TaxID=1314781 RepID=A0A165K4L4_EXIGL|nr:hypothetical protein EXIGLDRAFT_463317 [Exidia glandulosa HHB12029]